MKKYCFLLICFVAVQWTYAQSTITINPGTSISIGAGSAVTAGYRDGTLTSTGTFNARSITYDPAATAATSITQTSFNANWNASDGAAGYKLDVSTISDFSSFVTGYQNLDVGNVITYYVSSNLSAGSTYYYRLRAYDIDGITGYSNVITVVMAPLNPVATAATNINDINFSSNWNNVTGATGYYLDVSTDTGFGAGTFVVGFENKDVGNVLTYSVSGLAGNTTYYYRIRSYNASGTSGNSNTVTVLTAPPVPTATAATPIGQTSFSANWDASAGATKYYLDVSTVSNFSSYVTGYQNLDVDNATTYSVNTNITAGTAYYYRVRASNGTNTSTNSNTINLISVPPNPTSTAASNIQITSFDANWNVSTSATKYFLDVSTDAGFGAGTFVIGYENKDVGNVTSSSVNTNLSGGITYYYRVRANNTGGTSGNSGSITVLTIPPAPVAIAASTITQTSFFANWNASTGATKYYLDVSTDAGFGAGTFVTGYQNLDVDNVTTFSVNTNLTAGTTYYYRVRANNTTGTSNNSNGISLVTIPPNPTATSATNITEDSFNTNWNSSATATGYRLDVSTDAVFGAGTFVVGFQDKDVGDVTTYSVTGLLANTTYYYRVRAYNGNGTSGNSGNITQLTAPAVPTATAATLITQTSFDANWDASIGATGYRLDISTDNGFGAGTFVTGYQDKDIGNVLTFSVNTYLVEGTTYYYRIRSYNVGGISTNSGTINLKTIPDSPIESSATLVTPTSFQANWNASTGASGYRLDVATNSGFGAGTLVTGYDNKDVGNVTNSAVNTNLTEGTTYYYRIRAYNSGGTSNNSGTVTVITVPAMPSANEASSVQTTSFTANWNSSSGASGYTLDVSTDSNFGSYFDGYNNFDAGNVTSLNVTGLSSGTTYYYRVRAYNVSGSSGYSSVKTVITIPSAPVAIAATLITGTSFSANWNSSSGSSKYYLDVATDNTFSSFVAGFNNKDVGNNTTQSVTGLTEGTAYYYRVRANNASGTSANSNTKNVKIIPPAPVEQAASSITNNSFSANWNSSTGASGYYLDVATDNLFSSFVAGYNGKNVGDVTSYTVTGLSESTSYYYRVRAYNTGGTSDNSGTVNPVTLSNSLSEPSVQPASAVTSTSFSANWNSVTGATKYYLDVSTVSNFATFVVGWQNVNVNNVLTYSVNSNLSAGNTYYYRVRAANATSTSDNSNNVSVKTIPSAPVEQAASAITASNFDANWNASTGATGYYIDVATDNGFTSFVSGFSNRDVGNVVTYTITGLASSTQYFYRIRAYNTGGASGNSGTSDATTLAGGTVVATAATTITSLSFFANWNLYGGASGYKLDVATNSSFGAGTFLAGYQNLDVGNGTSSFVSPLSPGTNYYYRVTAYDAVPADIGTSGTINVLTLPADPTATAATSITEISFDANWNSVTSATGYYLDVATNDIFTTFVTGFNNKYVNNVTTYSVTGLTGGTTYYYRVRAKNGSGTGPSSSTITVLTLPDEPTATYATALTNNSFSANWNSSTGATGYRLDVSTVSGFGSFVGIYNNLDVGDVTTHSVTGLIGGTNYYYRIRAYNSSGSSSNSNTINALTLPAAPNSTTSTSITQTSFDANWDASNGATKYYLDVASTSSFNGGTYVSGYQNLDVNTALTYSISGLSSGTTYYYRVRAFNPSGTSGNSATQTVLTIPPDPNVISATNIQSTSFSANWETSTGATGYKLDVSTVSNFTSFVGIYNDLDVGAVITRSVTGLTGGVTYYYRLRSYNGNGTSNNSGTMTVVQAPVAPVATAASSITDATFQANWNSSSGADGYKIDVATDAVFSSIVVGYNDKDVGTATSFVVTGLNSGTTYYYQIRSYSASRTSGNSNSITVLTVPSAPVATAATSINESSFVANWNSSTGATKYYLDVATNNSFTSFVGGFNNKDVGNVTNYSVSGLSANSNYYYRIRSDNVTGTSGNSGTINVLSAPAIPTATAATSITNTSFNSNWNASTGATGYRLDVSTVSNFTSFVGIYNNKDVGNVITYSVAGLSGSTTYYYRVRAYNGGGISGNSGTINLTTAVNPSGVPTATAATNIAQTSFSANWNVVAGAEGYMMDVSTDWNFGAGTFVTNFENKDVGNVTTYSVTGLTNGNTYYYRLRSYNISGTSGNSGSITVLTLPGTPSANSATSLAVTSFSANWNASTGATGYYLDVATEIGFTSFVAGFNDQDVSNVTSYSVTGLAGGTTYYYRVRAYNGSGTSGNSGTITVLTLPSSPTATAATSLTETTFDANWNAVVGAAGYRLDVSTDVNFGAGTFLSGFQDKDVSGVTTYSISGLTGGTNYYYRLRAYNATGTGANSNTITALTLPSAPVATAATSVAGTSFSSNWNSAPGATKYYLDVATDSGFGAGTFVVGYQDKDVGVVTTYSVSGLTVNTNYYYRVRSFNPSGTSGNSNTITVLTAPSVPVTTAATSSAESSFNANWNAVAGATKYYLDVSSDVNFAAGSFETGYENKDVSNVSTYSVTEITGGTSHYYRVRSSNGDGISGNSGTITVLGVPNANSATAVTQTSFSSNWDAVTGITGYRLDVSTDINFSAGFFVAGFQNKDVGNVTAFPVTGLTPNTTYFYRVRSYDLNYTSGNSNTIIVKNLPTATVATNATGITQTSFIANWNASPGGAYGYILDVAYNPEFVNYVTGYENKIVYNVTSYVVNNVTEGTVYYYRVRAYNSLGTSDNSNTIDLLTIPSNPTATVASNITSTGFSANWNAVYGADKYYLDVATDSNFTNILVGYNNKDVANVTTFSATNVSKNTSFYYRIRSNNATGTSGNSNTISISTLPNYAPVLNNIETSSLNLTEGDSPQQITSSIIVNDLDNLNVESAVVQIITNYQSDEDILFFINQNGITGVWNQVNGTMTLLGTATIAQYQTAIRNVKYQNTSNCPKGLTRTLSFTVNDGIINSNILTRDISITSINSPPVISNIEADPLTYKIKQSPCSLTNSIVVEDTDDENNGCAIITITENYQKGEDELIFENQNGIIGNWDSDKGILYLYGNSAVSNYQAALRTVCYKNNKIIPNIIDRTISIKFDDGDDDNDESNIVFRKIVFPNSNFAPYLSYIEKSIIVYSRNSDRVTVSDSIVVSDEDNLFLQSGEVKIEEGFLVGEDVLEFTAPPYINAFYNWSNGTLTLSGQSNLTTYQNIFRSVKYKNIRGTESTKSNKKIVFSVTDGIENSNKATRQISVEGTITGVDDLSLGIPTEFKLCQNYPNPFNPTTKIRFGLPQESNVKLDIYNVLGERIIGLLDKTINAGFYEIDWDARNVPSGIYIYQIIARSSGSKGSFIKVMKMLLLK